MPIMTRMRDSMPVILFMLLIAFLITIIFEWGMDYLGIRGARADVVGTVNGKKITYKDFSQMVQRFADNQKAQTGADPDETQMEQVRNQVWQTLVNQELLNAQIKRLGLTVTDQELIDWVRGDNPPDDLKRQFIDSSGQFRRDLYDQFLSNPNQFIQDPSGTDPDYGGKWLATYEQSLRERRLEEELQSIVLASVHVPEGELRQRFTDANTKYEALYALFDAGALVKDSAVQVTDADLRSYYEDNIEQYKFDASRKLNYVLFPEIPSESDSSGREKDMEEAVRRAKSGEDFLQLVYTFSDRPDSGAYFRHGEMSEGLETPVFSAKVGDVVGPITDAEGLHLFKVLDERPGKDEYIHASHILLPLTGDTNAVKALARKIVEEARSGKDFAELAREYSKDPSSARRGGDLGWFTKGRMVPEFEKAAFAAKVGQVIGPVRTQFGLHIIKVLARDHRELKLANILMRITPSSQTRNDLYERAKDFAYNAKESEFTKEAQQLGFKVEETQLTEKGGVIPGIGANDAIVRWAFDNKKGSVSDPFTISNGYVDCEVAEVKDAGVRPLEEIKESIRPLVLRKLKIDKAKEIAQSVRARLAPGDSLTKVAVIDPGVAVQRTGQFTASGAVPGIGRDPAFIGAATALKPGEISPAVAGQRGAYLIQLVSETPFDSAAFASQKESLRTQLLQEKRNRFLTEWLQKLKENADIVDNREMFYR